MRLILLISILAFLLFTSPLPAETRDAKPLLKMTTCNWQPYAGVNLTNFGFTSDLLSILFSRLGYDTKIDILPWKRAMIMTKQGTYDLAYNAYFSQKRAKDYAFTDPYIHSRVHLCSRQDANVSYKRLSDLKPYRIGVVMGYVNSPEFDQADYLTKDEAVTDLHNLKKLFSNHLDMIVIDKFVAIQAIKTSPFLIANVTDIVFHEPALTTMPVHAIFSKAVPGYKKKVEEFNRELAKMI